MSENAIDSENISKPAPDTAKPKGAGQLSGREHMNISSAPARFGFYLMPDGPTGNWRAPVPFSLQRQNQGAGVGLC